MPHKAKWYHIDAVLGKPNHSLQAKLLVCSQAELSRWVVKHLSEGYTVTLTKVERTNAAASNALSGINHNAVKSNRNHL